MGPNKDGAGFGPEYPSLPIPPMLMFDRVVEVNKDGGDYGKGEVITELDINPDLWFFDCHFKLDPVMPGCLGLDALWQMLGFFMAWEGHKGKGRALGVKGVRYRGEISPTSKLVRFHIHIRRLTVGRLVMAVADGSVTVDDKEVYTTKDLKVGIFQPEDKKEGNEQ